MRPHQQPHHNRNKAIFVKRCNLINNLTNKFITTGRTKPCWRNDATPSTSSTTSSRQDEQSCIGETMQPHQHSHHNKNKTVLAKRCWQFLRLQGQSIEPQLREAVVRMADLRCGERMEPCTRAVTHIDLACTGPPRLGNHSSCAGFGAYCLPLRFSLCVVFTGREKFAIAPFLIWPLYQLRSAPSGSF